MEFDDKILEYREDSTISSSPIWIFFSKNGSDVTCNVCNTTLQRKNSSTGNMSHHLRRHHNFSSKYNAWKIFQELSAVKEERLQRLKKKHDEELKEEAERRNLNLKSGEEFTWALRGRGLQRHLVKLRKMD